MQSGSVLATRIAAARRGNLGFSDLIIALAAELDEAETVAEGIREVGDMAPLMSLDLTLEDGTLRLGLRRRRLHIFHHDVEMHRRPVTAIIADLEDGPGRLAAPG